MRQNTRILLLLIISIFTTAAQAAMKNEHYIFHYENESIYDVRITENTVTWESLNGVDKGQTETDDLKSLKSENIEVLQWSENDGTFVTVILNHADMTVISSGKYSAGIWLRSGKATFAK